MKYPLKYAERGLPFKVISISEHICGFGNKQLHKFGIEEGAVIEIDPSFVSQVLLDVNGRDILLGYESARMILIGDRRLTDVRPGNSGKITDIEGGYEANRRLKELGMKEGTEITLKSYPYLGEQHVMMNFQKIFTADMRELLKISPAEYIIVNSSGTEKQISFMEIGESGKIIKVIADKGKQEQFDREWIKEGNTIEIMHRLDPESIPLMVKVGDTSHVIGAGLTEKIFVEETTLPMT
jgi:Fe2+ transport system protein FeoA